MKTRSTIAMLLVAGVFVALAGSARGAPLAWFDASDFTTSTTSLDAWSDKSNSNDATQSTVDSMPAVVLDVQNGLPVVRFDDNDFLFNENTLIPGGTNRTIIAVVKADTISSDNTIVGDGEHIGAAGGMFQFTPEVAVRVMGGNRIFDTNTGTTDFRIATVLLNGDSTNDVSGFLDCVELGISSTGSRTINTEATVDGGRFAIGALKRTPTPDWGWYFDGDIAEIIIYDEALVEDGQGVDLREGIEYYLDWKWGLGLELPASAEEIQAAASEGFVVPEPGIPGDIYPVPGDGYVDGDDLGVLLSNWGSVDEGNPADLFPDGGNLLVDGDDIGVMLANWTGPPTPLTTGDNAAVPEPAGFTLLLLGALAMLGIYRKR